MVVELDVFSGRPNPRWELEDRQAATLRRLHGALRPADRTPPDPPDPPALGYRGFTYRGAPGLCRAYKGFVRAPRAVFADPSFTVERFLLDTLPQEYQAIGRQIASELRAG